MRRLALLAAAAAVALAGCSGGDPVPAPSPTGLNAGAACELPAGARQTRFGEHGADLGGVIVGSGKTGIVLAHQNGGDVCQWAPYAIELAGQGYRVLAFDFGGFGVSTSGDAGNPQQVAAAAATLRADGATGIVLVGASMGGTAVLAAAPTVTPAPLAVVALSAPSVFGANALDAAPKLTMPVFYAAGEFESSFADSARELHGLTPKTTAKELLIVPTDWHGVYLLTPGGSAATDTVRAKLAEFLKAHAPL
ncbi:alpha/beta fold hydrolase [Catellatospora sichuanensis]|uniref:alpha/beta fold hydrolase n=1 Tax=Catellatospora sichuanensis TaxID=1969805 RepID=UPI001183CA67|nr:alpha/beta hydrolase [Catellatospora sichuanensis]